jgi:hypothetical protein
MIKMRQETTFRIRVFRQALEEAAREQPEECRNGTRCGELKNFPVGSCDLASNCLAQYLKDCGEKGEPVILSMEGNKDYREAENSTIHSHVIVILDGEYIDLTLDQFDEYTDYILAEPLESGGVLGTLLRKIPQYEGKIETRRINLEHIKGIYTWLRDRAEGILKEDPEWQVREHSIEEAKKAARGMFPFLSTTPQTGTGVPGVDK